MTGKAPGRENLGKLNQESWFSLLSRVCFLMNERCHSQWLDHLYTLFVSAWEYVELLSIYIIVDALQQRAGNQLQICSSVFADARPKTQAASEADDMQAILVDWPCPGWYSKNGWINKSIANYDITARMMYISGDTIAEWHLPV